MTYILLFPEGLENFIISNLKLTNYEHYPGILLFDAQESEVNKIKNADEVILLLKKYSGINRYRSSLQNLRHQSQKTKKDLFAPGTRYFVKASYIGRHDYNAKEIEDAVTKGLKKKHKILWGTDRCIRVIIRPDIAFLGIKLNPVVDFQQGPGSLKRSIAYTMIGLLDLHPGEVFLDPMTGSGTLAKLAQNEGVTVIAGDLNPKADLNAVKWDARQTNLPDKSVDKVACNLPFGKQVERKDEQFYNQFTDEMTRVTKDNALMVFLTTDRDLLVKIFKKNNLELRQSIQVKNSGITSSILLVKKQKFINKPI